MNTGNDINSTNNALIFVTGGTGLVGSHLIKLLVAQGRKVRALYRSNIPEIEGGDKVEWVRSKILFPKFYWLCTSGEMRNDAERKYGKKGTETNVRRRRLK